jgi:hypothetical protein
VSLDTLRRPPHGRGQPTEGNHHVLHEAPFVPRAQRGPRDFPTADFWYLRNGKVEVFDCHIAFTTMFAQLGVQPDYASAVAASAPAP